MKDASHRDGTTEIERALRHIVVSTRSTAKSCAARRASGELTHVFRNVLVHTAYLADAPDRWDAARRVSAARICAVGVLLSPEWILLGQGAAFVHGLELTTDLFDVHVGRPGDIHRRSDPLPSITIPAGAPAAGVVPPARLIRHQTYLDEEHLIGSDMGIRLPDLATTAAQCARDLAAREASVIVSGALGVMSSFNRFHDHVAASRVREEAIRSEVTERLSRMPSTRGCRKARAVIAAADAACESVPERVLVWILRAAGFTRIDTQVHHRVGGRDYYVDVELAPGIALESDSRGKHETSGEAAADVHRSYERQASRQKALESIGLVVVRFSPAEYDDPDAVVAEIVRKCRIVPPPPVRLLRP